MQSASSDLSASSRRARLGPLALGAALLALVAGAGGAAPAAPAGAPLGVGQRLAAGMLRAREPRSFHASAWIGGPTTASTGEQVTVYVSGSVSPEVGTPQSWADFIAGLDHDSELSLLTAYIAPLSEVQALCGDGALGCYGGDRLVAMDETAYGVMPADVVRHEYGHHVASHRANTPWPAIDWGPKLWASTMNICRRVEERTAFPGDEGSSYMLNPGEGWAETYRLLEEQRAGVTGAPWEIVDRSFYPTEAALTAARQDVLEPWQAPRSTSFRHRFTAKGKRVWALALTTLLDGSLEITVSLPKSTLYNVTLLDSDRTTVLATGLWASSRTKRVTTTICGERSLYLRVSRKAGFGRVSVSATQP